MRINKKILRPERLRQVPAQFSWIDQRLVRENFLRQASPAAWALYLVLVTVADAQGLSYYSETTLSRLLQMEAAQLSGCRQQLVAADLVAYQKPLYQVLALPQPMAAPPQANPPRSGQALSLGEILRRAAQGGAA
ncbi:MAG: hypothetical protein EHM23_28515 [Acidobacteria bacterium]|nr:MAG: hypothetical protein EHM23_28515 [Acidobacteriota bacterium]